MRRLMAMVALAGAVCPADLRAAEGAPATRPAAKGVDWTAFLIHDSSVQAELKLDRERSESVRALLRQVELPLWQLRNLRPEDAAARSLPLAARVQEGLAGILTDAQRRRLAQITLQSRWPAVLLERQTAESLGLTGDQRRRIEATIERARLALEGLATLTAGGQRRDVWDQLAARVRTEQHSRALAVLDDRQKQQWAALAGRPFDLSRIKPLAVHAPEFAPGQPWINSDPLTLAGLRGKVILVHFWTFGCGNCIQNYPAYRTWQKAYAQTSLIIVGIHTPETQGERSLSAVRAKARENELNFPIVVDNDRKNWEAWSNNIWPAVYLVDKQGRIRYWWYGELNWKGAGGEKYITARIDELLAERE